jgi:hypothetical protein
MKDHPYLSLRIAKVIQQELETGWQGGGLGIKSMLELKNARECGKVLDFLFAFWRWRN